MEALTAYFNLFFSNSGALHAIYVSLILAFSSTTISFIIGVNCGLWLERNQFMGKNILIRIIRTLMGTPPVVVGLIVYLLIMRRGPLGSFNLLFTIQGMVLAQCFIIIPIITGLVYNSAQRLAPQVRFFALCVGANKSQTKKLIFKELGKEIYFAYVIGFGRSLSEVGAAMLIGGNIKEYTRSMTTTISLLKSQGVFTEGIILGLILLAISFSLQLLADFLRKEREEIANY